MRRQESVTEQLRYKFTADEHLDNTSKLVAKINDRSDMEAEHKAVKANLKQRAEAVTAEISRLARLVGDRFDMRDVQCRWDFGRPTENQKTLVRMDSMEDVRIEALLPHERQEMLKFEAPAHVLSGPGSLKDKKVTEVPDSDIDYYASRDVEELLKFNWIQVDIDAVFAEAKRRADVKEAAANNVTQMPAPGGPVLAVDNTVEKAEAEKGPYTPETPVCEHCTAGVAVTETPEGDHVHDIAGENGAPGSTVVCPVATAMAAAVGAAEIATPPTDEPVEAAHTLPSARAIDGPKRSRRAAASAGPAPTAEEREALEQMQAENAPAETLDTRDEAPEL